MTMGDARKAIAVILARQPELNDWGFGLYPGFPVDNLQAEMHRQRAALLNSGDEFRGVCAWIGATLSPQARTNERRSSYQLKHLYEAATGQYVTNGVFTAAMIHEGYTCESHRGNGFFNVSEQAVRAAYNRLGPRYALLAA